MNVAYRKPWTQAAFFAWEGHLDGRYEFNGVEPVAMNGVNIRHTLIQQNLLFALRSRLRRAGWHVMGPECGIETIGGAVRYPDLLVTKADLVDTAYVVPDPVVVFEVLSPTSGRIDRIVKVAEYAAIRTLRRYVIVEQSGVGLISLGRDDPASPWAVTALGAQDDVLDLPELDCGFPLGEIYEGIAFKPMETED